MTAHYTREPDVSGSARELVHKAFRTTVSRGHVAPFCYAMMPPGPCGELCDLLTAAIERDRTATIEACAREADEAALATQRRHDEIVRRAPDAAALPELSARHFEARDIAARIRALDTRKTWQED